MAERRMFAKTIIDSDAFIDMPVTARLLYYDLAMRADDDGFVNAPKKIMRMIGASQDDLSILAIKKFIIPFDNGVVVIKHWRIHNYIRGDTYKETQYKEEKEKLEFDENKAYRQRTVYEPSTSRQRTVYEPSTQDSIGKDSIGKDSIGKDNLNKNITSKKEINTNDSSKKFVPPTVEEVNAYCQEWGNLIDADLFVDFYASKGWKVGKESMKNWKAAVRNWYRHDKELGKVYKPKPTSKSNDLDFIFGSD